MTVNQADQENKKGGEPEGRHQLDDCVRCSSCLALCQTYQEGATEGMGARGRVALLRKLQTGDLKPSKKLDECIFSCMLCGACNTLCPRGIRITDAIYEARSRLRNQDKSRRLLGCGLTLLFNNAPAIFKGFAFVQGLKDVLPENRIKALGLVNEMGLKVAPSFLRAAGTLFRAERPRGRVAVFAGCTTNYLLPDMGKRLIEVLNRAHFDVVLPKSEVCCGAPLLGLGLKEDAAALMVRNVSIYRNLNVEAVISLCPTCIDFIDYESKRLVGEGIPNATDIARFFLGNGIRLPSGLPGNEALKTIYHESCHTAYHLKAKEEPRSILRDLGYRLAEPKERGCCGFAGLFRLFYEDLARGILQKRVEGYSGADLVVASCPNCVMQFRESMKGKQVKHIVELMAEAYERQRSAVRR